jgi:serine/threonine-protein kinase
MNYPENWVQQFTSNTLMFLSPREDDKDLFQENVNLMLQDLSNQSMSLEQYTELSQKQTMDHIDSSAIISLKNATIEGQQAKEFIYNLSYHERNLKVKQYWFIKDNIAYVFTYTAEQSQFSNYESTAMEMIRSFKFVK